MCEHGCYLNQGGSVYIHALTKIMGKFGEKYRFFSKFSENENTLVKMGELLGHFDKNILILRTFRKIFGIFLMIFLSIPILPVQ